MKLLVRTRFKKHYLLIIGGFVYICMCACMFLMNSSNMGKKKMYFDVQRLAVIYIWKKLNHFDAITNIIADLVCSDAEFLCFFNTLEQFAYAT